MDFIFNLLNNLRQLSGNTQILYLQENRNDLLKEVLEYCLDTHKKYKIDEGKYNKFDGIMSCDNFSSLALTIEDWNNYKELLDYLAEIKSAKDNDIIKVKQFINQFNDESKTFLEMILFKDLRINMGAKKIQRVWPDFCVTYPYMGCKPYTRKNLEGIVYPAYAQTKMDGSFCNIIVDLDNKNVQYVSRQSKPQPMQGSLDKVLFEISPIADEHFTSKFVLTGEVLVWDNEKNRPLPRKLSNGILRRQDKTPEELNSIHFVCWDFLPYDKFLQKKWGVPYSDRYNWLNTRLKKSDRIHIVNTWIVNSLDEAMKKFEEQYELGEEGVVIKSFEQIWQDGKPAGQVKIKAEKSCELRMIEFNEGKGNYAGMCGNIKCITDDNKLEVYVKPRTPEDAILLWNNQNLYIDKILEVKFNEVIYSDTKDKASLYLPVFVEIRDDKNETDNLEYIEAL